MDCQSTISVYQLLGDSITSRTSSNLLTEAVKASPCNFVEVDFTDVKFISRSFADQFHCEKLQLIQDTGKVIIVVNANEEVISMLQVVAKTAVGDRMVKRVPIYKYTNYWELEEYLLSL